MQCVGPNAFNTAAYDTERLQLDDKVWRLHRKAKKWRKCQSGLMPVLLTSPPQARSAMINKAALESAEESAAPGSKEGAWKWAIRKKMWDYMEEHDVAR